MVDAWAGTTPWDAEVPSVNGYSNGHGAEPTAEWSAEPAEAVVEPTPNGLPSRLRLSPSPTAEWNAEPTEAVAETAEPSEAVAETAEPTEVVCRKP